MDGSVRGFLESYPAWCRGKGAKPEIILSSRARLARNLTGRPFVHRTKKTELARILEKISEAVQASSFGENAVFFAMPELSELSRRYLMERRLISPALVHVSRPSGVFVLSDETASLMINEEDHLRIQAMQGGLDLEAAWEAADRIDNELGQRLDYAFCEKFGYLTACPTNVGTGIRMSVLIHLPGLTLTQAIDPVINGMRDIGFTVRGLYGEGTDALGNLYQLSNQWTLGVSEPEIIVRLNNVISRLIDYESQAVDALLNEAGTCMEDRIWRSYGLLLHARLLSERDALEALSMLRLGLSAGLFSKLDTDCLNRLTMKAQSAHIQMMSNQESDLEAQNIFRADMVRHAINPASPLTN